MAKKSELSSMPTKGIDEMSDIEFIIVLMLAQEQELQAKTLRLCQEVMIMQNQSVARNLLTMASR
jgi:hypothetical protein